MKQRFISMAELDKVIAEKLDNDLEMVNLGIISLADFNLGKEALESLKRRAFLNSSIIENLEIA